MLISLITATLNRSGALSQLLASLAIQTHEQFELIIVDQSDEVEYRENEKSIRESGIDLHTVRHIRLREKGLSHARNVGLPFAKGDIIGFPDDDCWYHRDFLSDVARFFADRKSQKCAFISGLYAEPGTNNPAFSAEPHQVSIWRKLKDFSSVTLFIDANIIRNLSLRFDEWLGAGAKYGTAEELDLVMQLLVKGYHGWYEPKLLVYHRILRPNSTYAKSNGAANAYIYSKYLRRNAIVFVKAVLSTVLLGLRGIGSSKSRALFGDRLKYWFT